MSDLRGLDAGAQQRLLAGDVHQLHAEVQRDQLRNRGQRGLGTAADVEHLLHAAGHAIDQGSVATLTLAWLLNSPGFDGRSGKWAALLSGWTLAIVKCSRDEEEILGVIAASITSRAEIDEALIAIAQKKQPHRTLAMPPPTVELDESLLVLPLLIFW